MKRDATDFSSATAGTIAVTARTLANTAGAATTFSSPTNVSVFRLPTNLRTTNLRPSPRASAGTSRGVPAVRHPTPLAREAGVKEENA